MKSLHFVGIAGSGMSGIAQFLNKEYTITGSDRNFDAGIQMTLKEKLENLGIQIYPQDGSGVLGKDTIISSSAVEDNNPDIIQARIHGIPIRRRPELLKEIIQQHTSIAVAGTCGKSTTTALIFELLHGSGIKSNLITGGILLSLKSLGLIGNAYKDTSDKLIFEADESDASLRNYTPHIGVITNIDLDHKPLDELYKIFTDFANNTQQLLIYNADCPNIRTISKHFRTNAIRYGFDSDCEYHIDEYSLTPGVTAFKVHGTSYQLNIAGRHNIYNALPGIILGDLYKADIKKLQDSLKHFGGVERRMQEVKQIRGIRVFDDFAHNPSKLRAAIQTVKLYGPHIIAIFQPHGFLPVKLIQTELIQAFSSVLDTEDLLLLPEIFYFGVREDPNTSSKHLADAINQKVGKNIAYFFEKKEHINGFLAQNPSLLANKSSILVMGARDQNLQAFTHSLHF